jgi:hypothetical protein
LPDVFCKQSHLQPLHGYIVLAGLASLSRSS